MKILLTTTLLLISGYVFSQDLIVTAQGDSLNCLITEQKSDFIYFTLRNKDDTGTFESLLPLSQVVYLQRGYYVNTTLLPELKQPYKGYSKIRIGIHGGFSYRLAPVPDNSGLEEYYKDLKSGFSIGGDFAYFLSKVSGIGFKVSQFRSQAQVSGLFTMPGSAPIATTISDNISILFIGPTYTARFLKPYNNNAIILRGGLGYIGYKDKFVISGITQGTITAFSPGISAELGYDIGLSDNLALVLLIGFTTGYYESYEIEDASGMTSNETFNTGEGDNLLRINISAGFRFGD